MARKVEFLGRPSTGEGREDTCVPAVAAVVIVDAVGVLNPFMTLRGALRMPALLSTEGLRALTTSLIALA